MWKRGYNPNELFHFLTWFILRSQGAEYQNKGWHAMHSGRHHSGGHHLDCVVIDYLLAIILSGMQCPVNQI